ncbi:MAG: RtcB family protein [Deltaproteobacteria bacterium]|nr:MAG: RtcB family protein [Deltaproteobacteria bacterium]
MRVPGRIFADPDLLETIVGDRSIEQVRNVAHLPGIVGASIAMPDIHWGYGFPIGGVAAVDADDGAVSPGGVGYDINCGVRLVATDLPRKAVFDRREQVAAALYDAIPCGVGSRNQGLRLSHRDLDGVLRKGARWAMEAGFAVAEHDLEVCEEGGTFEGADPGAVSRRARERGAPQLGTLGSGNHFCEVQVVERIYDREVAAAFGLAEGAVTITIHSGSRGLGHQVCEDAVRDLVRAMDRYGPDYRAIPDRQLACAPIGSPEGEAYLAAMRAAANFAFANRQVMAARAVRALEHVLGVAPADHRARVVYDVCHNIAKVETHTVDGRRRRLLVHRKGATRSFPAGDARIPAKYRPVGQPVIVPGDMGRRSYVLVGAPAGLELAFGSSAHGAGRVLSRRKALERGRRRDIVSELAAEGIAVAARSRRTLAEEMSEAYKDVDDVTDVVERAGLSRRVARLRPMVVVKG